MPGKLQFSELPWPSGGLSEHLAYGDQETPNPYTGQRQTTVSAQNVRNYDPTTQRLRGAQRAGTTKYIGTRLNGANFIQHINQIISSSTTASTGLSQRTTLGVAVAGGNVLSFASGAWGSTINGTGALSSTFPFVNSAILFGVAYFVDGTNYKKWTAATDTVAAWTASAGTIPANGLYKPRLCCTWRGRIVLSGVTGDDQNWFMSAVNNALDWDYGATPVTETIAVAGNNSLAGQCQDVVNALIPFNDDLLWLGGDHSIWQMTGDPMEGGRLDLVTDITGIAFGTAFCKDPNGLLYFFGGHGGLWSIAPQGLPKRLSAEKIENRLASVNLATNKVSLVWDDRAQSVHIFITPTTAGTTTHYVYDTRNNAFWPDVFSNTGHNPTAAKLLQGDTPAERIMLLGGQDGYLRYIDLTAKSDDGTAISSYVYLGPILGSGGLNRRITEICAQLGTSSDTVVFELFDGASPQQAFEKTVNRYMGRWRAGRNRSDQRICKGNAIYLKLSSNELNKAWQLEGITAALDVIGRAASRIF